MPTKITVICFWCKRPVGRIQEKKGKAFCKKCGDAIFRPERPKRPISVKMYEIQKRQEEEKIVMKVLSRILRKLD